MNTASPALSDETGSAEARQQVLAEGGLARDAAGMLVMDGVSLAAVADAVGTPVFLYGAEAIRRRYGVFSGAFGSIRHRIRYAVKANGNLAILRVLANLGAGADIVSGGELRRCLAAGIEPGAIVFSGVGKTPADLETAVEAGIACINVESVAELGVLGALARRAGRRVGVGLRLNPDVRAETHPYIATGAAGIKFGIPLDDVPAALDLLDRDALRLTALTVHVGSQILDPAPFRAGAEFLVQVLEVVRAAGVDTVEALDLGGGLGIRYGGERPLTVADYAAAVIPVVRATGLELHLQPGRFLVGNAGVLAATVLYRKRTGGKNVLVLDAGMNELGRPSRYGAFHDIIPLAGGVVDDTPFDVVGPLCETGDFLALGRLLPGALGPSDRVAVLGAGAYGFVMGSTYNARPRPPEVLVDGGAWGVARRRETMEELMTGEVVHPLLGGEGTHA